MSAQLEHKKVPSSNDETGDVNVLTGRVEVLLARWVTVLEDDWSEGTSPYLQKVKLCYSETALVTWTQKWYFIPWSHNASPWDPSLSLT